MNFQKLEEYVEEVVRFYPSGHVLFNASAVRKFKLEKFKYVTVYKNVASGTPAFKFTASNETGESRRLVKLNGYASFPAPSFLLGTKWFDPRKTVSMKLNGSPERNELTLYTERFRAASGI